MTKNFCGSLAIVMGVIGFVAPSARAERLASFDQTSCDAPTVYLTGRGPDNQSVTFEGDCWNPGASIGVALLSEQPCSYHPQGVIGGQSVVADDSGHISGGFDGVCSCDNGRAYFLAGDLDAQVALYSDHFGFCAP